MLLSISVNVFQFHALFLLMDFVSVSTLIL